MSNRDGELRTTPNVYDRDRGLFEHAYQYGDILTRASIELDKGLDELSPVRVKDGQPVFNIIDTNVFTEELIVLGTNAIAAVEKADANNEGSWVDFFRLASQSTTLLERLYAEPYFMSYESFSQRHNLVNGVSAKFAKIIIHALLQHAAIEERLENETSETMRNQYQRELGQLKGSISELTILSLANYDEVSSRLAITPRLYDDLYGKTDMILYHSRPREKESYKVPVQIKTTRKSLDKRQIPTDGFALFLSDYDPDGNNTLATLLVMHFDDPSRLTPNMEQYIMNAKNKLNRDIRRRIAINPGVKLPYIDGVIPESPQTFQQVAQAIDRLTSDQASILQ